MPAAWSVAVFQNVRPDPVFEDQRPEDLEGKFVMGALLFVHRLVKRIDRPLDLGDAPAFLRRQRVQAMNKFQILAGQLIEFARDARGAILIMRAHISFGQLSCRPPHS